MNLLIIGDPHGNVDKLKQITYENVDAILITGDLGQATIMRKAAFENVERQKQGLPKKEITPTLKKKAFMEAYTSSLKVIKFLAKKAPVYTIYGNVESSNAQTKKLSKEIGMKLPLLTNTLNAIPKVKVINNKLIMIKGVRIGGLEYFVDTNWVRDFKPGDYEKRMTAAKKATAKAKQVLKKFGKVDILICHQPPYGTLDKVGPMAPQAWQGKNAGSELILRYIKQKQPTYVFCGHIHEGEGTQTIGKTKVYNLGVGGHKLIQLK